ncbi:unnamed protein product [Absidia cylindrospora]
MRRRQQNQKCQYQQQQQHHNQQSPQQQQPLQPKQHQELNEEHQLHIDQPHSQPPEQRLSTSTKRAQRQSKASKHYQHNVDRYYRQLTKGCGYSECNNRFCASARGGVLQIHSQAALSLSLVLASKSTTKFCSTNPAGKNEKRSLTLSQPTIQPPATTSTHINNSDDSISPWSTIPFLHTLLNSPIFSHFVGGGKQPVDPMKNVSTPSTPIPDRRITTTTTEADDNIDMTIQRILDAGDDSPFDKHTTLGFVSELFRHWETIGNAFLDQHRPLPLHLDLDDEWYASVEIKMVLMFYDRILQNSKKKKSLRLAEMVSESFEVLLDRMDMNMTSISTTTTKVADTCMMVQWIRSLYCLVVWITRQLDIKPDHPAFPTTAADTNSSAMSASSSLAGILASTRIWPSVLTQKFIQVISQLSDAKLGSLHKIMMEVFSRLEPTVMKSMVDHLHSYLLDHFHVGPYRHGGKDTVVMAVKTLLVFYQANTLNPRAPIILPEQFVNETLCNKLNIKDEYRIWKRVLAYGEGRPSAATLTALRHQHPRRHRDHHHNPTGNNSNNNNISGLMNEQQRRSRLFLTANVTSILLPYPFVNEYQFSWFSYAFLLTPVVKRKVLLMDCMTSMSMEYEDACVNHTLLVQAQRLLSSDAPHMVKSLEHHLKSAICPYLLLEIRRQHFVDDTLHQLSRKWSDLKKPLKVKFVDGGEEGVDQGGVQKEFFGVLFEHLLDKALGLFTCDDDGTRLYWFRPSLTPDTRSYEMVGVLLGLAIYNGIILNLQFPMVLWKVLCMSSEEKVDALAAAAATNGDGDEPSLFTLDDLKQGWPQLAHGLEQLLAWSEQDNGMTVEDAFCQNYEMTTETFEAGVQTVPLQENGDQIPVTKANRHQFVKDYCTHFMYWRQREAILAVRRGVWCVIGGQALQSVLFPHELEMITCGWEQDAVDHHLDMAELEKVTEYDDGYHTDHPVVLHFWKIVHHDLTAIQKRKLLYFVTASDRVPVGGLKELTFVLQRNGPDSDRLPTALTCFSRLLLPEYANYEKLRDRLITSIENAKGFGLV